MMSNFDFKGSPNRLFVSMLFLSVKSELRKEVQVCVREMEREIEREREIDEERERDCLRYSVCV